MESEVSMAAEAGKESNSEGVVTSADGMTKQEFYRAFREIPKAELHLHLEVCLL